MFTLQYHNEKQFKNVENYQRLLINFYKPSRENLPLSLNNQVDMPDLLEKGVQGGGGDVREAVVLQEAVLQLPFSHSQLICLQSGTGH
jgi:hypothetical protein